MAFGAGEASREAAVAGPSGLAVSGLAFSDLAFSDLAFSRRATLRDADRLKQIEDRTFSCDRLSARSIRRAILSPTQNVLVLTSPDGEIVAAAFLHYRRRSQACRLHSIAVSGGMPRCRLGRRLLSACERDAEQRRCRELRLEVRVDNPAVITFYERHDYRRVGLQAAFYEDGIDAFSYAKEGLG